jgi:hypothetical protein
VILETELQSKNVAPNGDTISVPPITVKEKMKIPLTLLCV